MGFKRATRIHEVLRYDRNYDVETPVVEGFPNFWFVQKDPDAGHKNMQLEAGINRVMSVKAVDAPRTPAIALRSSPWKAGQESTPWHDEFDLDRGRVRYFGDHKISTLGPVGSTRGNAALLEAWRLHASGDVRDRMLACPLLVFRASPQTVDGVLKPKGYMEFCGVGVMQDLELVVQRDPGGQGTFPNFVIDVIILQLPEDEFDWRWIDDRREPTLTAEETMRYAPESWKTWVARGRSALQSVRRRVVESQTRAPVEQIPVPGSPDEAVLLQIRRGFEEDKAGFERLAAKAAERVISAGGTSTGPGWLTGSGTGGGMDFVGRLDVGNTSASTPLRVLGRAACIDPGGEISADEVARVFARLQRGWIGVFVTTGTFSRQAQTEVADEDCPVILINGRVLVETVSTLAEESSGGDLEGFLSSFLTPDSGAGVGGTQLEPGVG